MSDTTPEDVARIVHSIQLSVAPVFLLSGIGVLLGVLTNRLARVVDRARPLEEQHGSADPAAATELYSQLRWLAQRARLMNTAITLSTVSALLVAVVVALLFGSAFVHFNLAAPVAALFIAAMLALVGALVAFLIEIRIATATLRIGPRDG
ncbi:MAG TPA: DUF2721 domain-containing protein [Steroidobacteraceae bacterium]|nr:DUF2721 domain-containing protein [Steroidobacteraceae bacterium]